MMKKTISVMLVLSMVLSCAVSLSVSAAENGDGRAAAENSVYLLGDANLDSNVSIFDVTEIQRSLAELTTFSGLQTELAQVDGNELSIQTATLIQKYLAEMDTGLPIGEPAGDENEGVVYAESVPWYQIDEVGEASEKHDTFFSTEYPQVAFVSDSLVIQYFLAGTGYATDCELIVTNGGMTRTFALPMGTYVVFDYENKVMIFSDYTTTLTVNGFASYNPFSTMAPVDCTLYRTDEKDLYYGGEPMEATFAYDEVPMLKSGDEILIPLQTMSDLFFSYIGLFLQYNGEGVYMLTNSADAAFPDYFAQYSNIEKHDTVSYALAQVNYYELCNVLDLRYGLQAAHNIASFDAYFTRKGFKERMLTTDLVSIEKAQQDISRNLFEDFHSGATMQSVFLTDTVVSDSPYSPVFYNRIVKMNRVKSARADALGAQLGTDFPNYQRIGDTVFITFDSFTFGNGSGPDYFYTESYVPTADGNTTDTVDLFHYALERLQNEDKDAKNVVIDISCNGGGAVYSCAYAMQAISGQCTIVLQNPNTWALHQCVYQFDLNLDGTIDENDKSMLELGFNVAVISSDASFSCGNMLPCTLDSLDDRILLLGQQSGGGACEVGYISTAVNSTMQISSECRFATMKNGYIRDIDGGVAPDIYLSLNRMYDRDYIVGVVNDAFGV